MSRAVVVVHGGWHTGAHWTPVVDRLRADGLDASAPTLPGRDGDGVPPGEVDVSACARRVVEHLERHDLRDVVLVGHSSGGPVVQRTAELAADRIGRLVFLAAFVLRDGESVLDSVGPEVAGPFDALVAPDGTVTLPWDLWRGVFMHDGTDQECRRAYDTLVPEPYGVLQERVPLPAGVTGTLPSTYISCRQDVNLPPPGWHPGFSSRLGAVDVLEIDGSHEVVFTRPAELAAAIARAARTPG